MSGRYGGRPTPPSLLRVDLDHPDAHPHRAHPEHPPPGPPPFRPQHRPYPDSYGPPRRRPYPPPGHEPRHASRLDGSSQLKDRLEDGESPPPDQDVLAFIRAQQASSTPSKLDKHAEKLKMERFQHGASTKKSKVQKEREEAEKKRKRLEEEAADAYKDFVRAMQVEDTQAKDHAKGFVAAGGKSEYAGSRAAHGKTAQQHQRKTPSTAAFGDVAEDDKSPDGLKAEPPIKRKKAMEDFLGELQRGQAEREERLRDKLGDGTSISSLIALEGQKKGYRNMGDSRSTNICVLNLPAHATDDSLGDFFSQWGDVATVKIMWPRGEEPFGGPGGSGCGQRQDRLSGLTGFVAFMNRKDAEFCLKETEGISWDGNLIKTGWSKALNLPPRPRYVLNLSSKSTKNITRAASPSAPTDTWINPTAGAERPAKLVVKHRRERPEGRSPSPRSRVRSTLANRDPKIQDFIETVASRIKEHGPRFEDVITEREKDNPKFVFLRDEKSDEHHFFRMCLDERYQPLLPPKAFEDEGYESLYSTDSEEDSESEKMRRIRKADTVGPIARRRLEAMLRGLTPRRERIAKVMAFAIDHAFAADAIAGLLCQSVMIPTTPIPRKIARLHAISDILHNSAAPVPNAWKYRQAFETRLPQIFEHLGQTMVSFPGRMKAEGFRKQVMSVIECWENWLVLSPMVLETLVQALNSDTKSAEMPATAIDEALVEETPPRAKVEERKEDLDGEEMETTPPKPAKEFAAEDEEEEMDLEMEEEDLDGEAL